MTKHRSQFALWEAATQRRRDDDEAERQRTLAVLLAWLDEHAAGHGIEEAWAFGSLIRPGRFRARSDVDLAFAGDPQLRLFRIAAELTMELERDVDVLLLEECPFANQIVQEGIRWTRSRSVV